jgi:SAM-dependent methyltransferase
MTDSTISYYDNHADIFYEQTVDVDMSPLYERFLAHVPDGGHILDAGCGSGRDAKAFLDRGYAVTAFDASAALAAKASALLGQEVRCRRFDEIDEIGKFDAVWACASLLHVKDTDLPRAMNSLVEALRRGGTFYASFKKGTGERTDGHGRHFTNMTLESLQQLIGRIDNLVQLDAWETLDQRPGRGDESWWNFIGRRS